MSKYLLLYILFFLLAVSCDTSKNIKPTSDQYFLKFYGQTGDQEGVDVKQTPDGGFIIAGNSIATFGGTSDYLLIKVDAQGNQEWQKTYDLGDEDRMTEVVAINNEYIIAGTSKVNNYNKIMLLRVDLEGTQLDSYEVEKDSTYNYSCTGLSYSDSKNFLVVGSVDSPVGVSINGNSIFIILSNDWNKKTTKYSGIKDKGLTFIKAYEIPDIQTQLLDYLVFGFKKNIAGELEMGLDQYDDQLEPKNTSSYSTALNAKTIDVIPIENGQFMMVGASDNVDVTKNLSILMQAHMESDGLYYVGTGNLIRSGNNIILANGIAQIDQEQYVISGDIQVEGSTSTIATIFSSNSNGGVDWIRKFGTTSSYRAGKVIVLADGSIVFTGTAGLESQTKMFLIKMKSNGQMN